jgi:hypothetical protein
VSGSDERARGTSPRARGRRRWSLRVAAVCLQRLVGRRSYLAALGFLVAWFGARLGPCVGAASLERTKSGESEKRAQLKCEGDAYGPTKFEFDGRPWNRADRVPGLALPPSISGK